MFRSILIFGPFVFASCSYDFGGADGEGGATSSSTAIGFTNAPATGTTATQATNTTPNASSNVTTTDGPTAGSTGVDVTSSSTGLPDMPLARCADMSDDFTNEDYVKWFYLGSTDTDAGFLRVRPQSVGPLTLGGALSHGLYAIGECTLTVKGVFIDSGNPLVGVAVADVDFNDLANVGWLAITWDGSTVRSEVRRGVVVTPGPSMALASLERLTIHFTGTSARLYADMTFIGTIDATLWVMGQHNVFAGALNDGNSRIDQFNPALMSSDVP